jgi:hypothetical protein
MSDDTPIKIDLFFGYIEIIRLPERITEDGWHVYRSLHQWKRLDGTIERESIFEGARWRMEGPEPTLWMRFLDWLYR